MLKITNPNQVNSMKVYSRFKVGDKVWADHSQSWTSLVQHRFPHTEKSAIPVNEDTVLHDLDLRQVTVSKVYVCVTAKYGPRVIYEFREYGTSTRSEAALGATREEALVRAGRAYITRLKSELIYYERGLEDRDNLYPSQLPKFKKIIRIAYGLLSKYTPYARQNLNQIGKFKRPYCRLDTPWEIGQTFWTSPKADADSPEEAISVERNAVRRYTVKEILSSAGRVRIDYGWFEFSERCIFHTAREAREFFRDNVFVGGEPMPRAKAVSDAKRRMSRELKNLTFKGQREMRRIIERLA